MCGGTGEEWGVHGNRVYGIREVCVCWDARGRVCVMKGAWRWRREGIISVFMDLSNTNLLLYYLVCRSHI